MVILLDLSKNRSFWLPIYIMNDESFQSGPYLILMIFEILLYILAGVILCSTVRIFTRYPHFHKNMNTMMAWFLFQWFEAIIAKIVILPFQIGIFKVSDSNVPYVSWWSSDPTEMIKVSQLTEQTSVLLIAGFMVWHYAYSMIFGIINLGLERIFATILLKDYENTPRAYIPVVLLICTHIITLIFSFLVSTNQTGFYIGTSPCFINSLVTFGMFLIVWKVNEHRRERMENSGPECDYTLAQKFQVTENYRALMLAKNLLIVVLCAMSVPCALLISLVAGWTTSWKMLFIHVMENSIYLNPIIICTVLMCSAPSWRQAYWKYIPILNRIKPSKVCVVRPASSRNPENVATNMEKEGNMYFEQLTSAWDKAYKP